MKETNALKYIDLNLYELMNHSVSSIQMMHF